VNVVKEEVKFVVDLYFNKKNPFLTLVFGGKEFFVQYGHQLL
jgi:hypothetical protein